VILMADLTSSSNRGRAVAARSASTRLGAIVGPILGAGIATAFELRAIFLFNGITKLAVLAIVVFLIRETITRTVSEGRRPHGFSLDASVLRMFATRSFLIISIVTLFVSMMSQGVFTTLFPVFLKESQGFSTAEVGSLVTIAGIAILAISLPNGYLVDRYGRKATLVPGLVIVSLAGFLLAGAGDYQTAVLIVVLYGIGEGMCMGASQVYAMDLAPEDRRGAFLGTWSMLNSAGGAVAPLLVGLTATLFGLEVAFAAVAVGLAAVAGGMLLWGPDSRAKRATPAAPTPSST
jgi:MFS family permease